MKQKIKSVDVVTSRFRNSLFFGGILLIFSMRYRYDILLLNRNWSEMPRIAFQDFLMLSLKLSGVLLLISSVVFYILKKINDRKIEKIKREGYLTKMQIGEIVRISGKKCRVKVVGMWSSPDIDEYYLSPVTKDEAIMKLPAGTPVDVYFDPADNRNFYIDTQKIGSFI